MTTPGAFRRTRRRGLETHRSSENVTLPTYFTDWDKSVTTRDLLPHEYIIHGMGSFGARGPWTPDYNVPMRDSLLWLYEGQTDFWGKVLETRSGSSPSSSARPAGL